MQKSEIVKTLLKTELERFAETVKLIEQIPTDIIDVNKSYFVRKYKHDETYELHLVSINNCACCLTFSIEIGEIGSIFWTCDNFNLIEESYFYNDSFDFKYLFDFISKILKSPVSSEVICVNNKPIKGSYTFEFSDGDELTADFNVGCIYPWNKTEKKFFNYSSWL